MGADNPPRLGLLDRAPFRAVNGYRCSETPGMLGVWTNRFQHQVQFVGAIDLARYGVGHNGTNRVSKFTLIRPVLPVGLRMSSLRLTRLHARVASLV